MLIYVLDHSVDAARPVALAEARGHSWEHVAIKREKALSLDVELIENVTLRTAAEAALADGAAIVVYRDEIPPDS